MPLPRRTGADRAKKDQCRLAPHRESAINGYGTTPNVHNSDLKVGSHIRRQYLVIPEKESESVPTVVETSGGLAVTLLHHGECETVPLDSGLVVPPVLPPIALHSGQRIESAPGSPGFASSSNASSCRRQGNAASAGRLTATGTERAPTAWRRSVSGALR